MRKLFVLALGAVIALGLAASAFAVTADNAYLNVRITVVSGTLSILRTTTDTISATGLALSSNYIFPARSDFQNDSTDMVEDYEIRAETGFTDGTNTWALIGGVPGTPMTNVDEARMALLWANNWDAPVTPIVLTDFETNDVVTLVNQISTNQVFARPQAVDNGFQGFDVPVGATRSLFVDVDTPMVGSSSINVAMQSPLRLTALNGF